MRDQGLILAGLLVFLGIITFPFSYNIVTGNTAKAPVLQLPAVEKQCVAPIEYMRPRT